jgi:hypothetical protein
MAIDSRVRDADLGGHAAQGQSCGPIAFDETKSRIYQSAAQIAVVIPFGC